MSGTLVAMLIVAAICFAVLCVSFVQRWQTARARKRAQLAAQLEAHRVEASDHRRVAGGLADKAAVLTGRAGELQEKAEAIQQQAEEEARQAERSEQSAGEAARRLWRSNGSGPRQPSRV